MALTDDMQCSLTMMWLSTFGMIISFLLKSYPFVFVFLTVFLCCGVSATKQFTDQYSNNKKADIHGNLDEIELQPLEIADAAKQQQQLPLKKDMTIGELLAKY